MQIKELTLDDIKQAKIFRYVDDENQEIVAEHFSGDIGENTGYYLITGEVKFKDGMTYSAIFGISSDDSGEMFEYHFLSEKGWITSKDDICKVLNKKKSEIFPFKYRLNCRVLGDIHTDEQY